MKLLYCKECRSVRDIKRGDDLNATLCECGKSRGRYLEDGWHSEVSGPCEVLGLDNFTFRTAKLTIDFYNGEYGPDIRCWMFPHDYHRVKRLE